MVTMAEISVEVLKGSYPTEQDVADVLDLQPHLTRKEFDREAAAARVREFPMKQDRSLAVARSVEGRIIGMAILTIIEEVIGVKGYVDSVVVDPKYRGQGIAKRLMQALEEQAQAASASSLDLTPTKGPASQLYEGLGYEVLDTIFMSKKIR